MSNGLSTCHKYRNYPTMGLANLSDDDGQREETSDSPSVSYLYLYEQGRKEIQEWTEEKRQVMARAYAAVSGGGIVRNTFKRSGDFINIHDATAHLMVCLEEGFENGNWTPYLEFLSEDSEVQAEILQQFLDENPEVAEQLNTQVQAAD